MNKMNELINKNGEINHKEIVYALLLLNAKKNLSYNTHSSKIQMAVCPSGESVFNYHDTDLVYNALKKAFAKHYEAIVSDFDNELRQMLSEVKERYISDITQEYSKQLIDLQSVDGVNNRKEEEA